MHKLFLNPLFVGLLGALRVWCKMTITVIDVRPIVVRKSTFGLFSICMGVVMVRVTL